MSPSLVFMEQMAIVLGLLTATAALLTWTSSRSFVALLKPSGLSLMDNRFYQGYYKQHSIFWSCFAFILFIHLTMGSMHVILNSFANDPDAYLHTYVLITGLLGLVFTGTIVTSCRSLLGFLKIMFLQSPLSLPRFRNFYRLHSIFWLALLALVIGHYVFSYLHIGGFWLSG